MDAAHAPHLGRQRRREKQRDYDRCRRATPERAGHLPSTYQITPGTAESSGILGSTVLAVTLRWVSAALFCALLPLCAAEISLTGRVVDEDGAPVGGTRISLRPAGEPDTTAQTIQTVANPIGAFSVRLPAAGSYLVSAEREGYFPLKNLSLQVAEGANEAHLVLNHVRELFESVNVASSVSPIDLDRPSAERELNKVQIMNVPYPSTHDLRNAIKLMPGVLQDTSGALHFNGSAENQVLYTMDGFNISDPLTGRFSTRLSVEAVRSMDYSSGRFSPEFGKGSSGALAIQTETGDDQWRYSATNFVPGLDTLKGVHIGAWTPRFNLSGPIVKGRVWFSDNVDGEYSQLVISDVPAGKDRSSTVRGDNLVHTQFNLKPSNILYADFLVNGQSSVYLGLSALTPISTTTDQRLRTWFFSFKDQIYLSHGMLLELGFGENRTFLRQIPQGNNLYIIAPNGKQGNYFVDSTQTSRRDQFLTNLFLPAFHLAGAHQLKAGIDLDRLNYGQDIRRTGFEQIGLAGEVLRRVTFGGSGVASRPSLEMSSYLLDEWRLKPNLLLEIGIRQDWDELVRSTVLSPRAAFTYAPFGSKTTKLSGGYAVVYDASSLQLFSRPLDQYSLATYYNTDGAVQSGPLATVFTIQNAHLKAPKYQNWSLGLERSLPRNIDLQVNFLRKRGHDGFTYINTLGDPSAPPPPAAFNATGFDSVFNLTNQRRDVYDSAEIVIHQPLHEQYEWMASYVRSRALSNAVFDITVDQPMLISNNVGRMPWDSPNRFLSWGYLPTPRKNWALAYLFETRSGFPFSVVNQFGQTVGAANSSHFPAYFDINLHLERRFRLRGYRLALRGGFNNVTNHRNYTVVNNTLGAPQFHSFYGSDGRHFVVRLRWLGKE